MNKKLDFNEIDIELFNKVKEIIEKNSHYLKEPLRDEEIFYEVTKKIIVPAIFCIIATIHTVVSPVVDVPGPGYSVTYYE